MTLTSCIFAECMRECFPFRNQLLFGGRSNHVSRFVYEEPDSTYALPNLEFLCHIWTCILKTTQALTSLSASRSLINFVLKLVLIFFFVASYKKTDEKIRFLLLSFLLQQ